MEHNFSLAFFAQYFSQKGGSQAEFPSLWLGTIAGVTLEQVFKRFK